MTGRKSRGNAGHFPCDASVAPHLFDMITEQPQRTIAIMPAIEATISQDEGAADSELRFPPVTREHILHCSYDYWFPKCDLHLTSLSPPELPRLLTVPRRYRTSCIRSRIIPLTPDFISYLQEDGIILADEGGNNTSDAAAASDDDADDWEPSFTSSTPAPRPDLEEEPSSDSDSEDDEDPTAVARRQPPNLRFPALHAAITEAIAALGGAACPKLNWSSPKDATWISRHPNTMKCTSANDVYILLKSSSFISHDLLHAFDDTVPPPANSHDTTTATTTTTTIPASQATSSSSPPAPPLPPRDFNPVLVLRSFFNPLPSLEFRCFVKDRGLVAVSQRDLNHYGFLVADPGLRRQIVRRARELFESRLRLTFPDPCFVFDVYIPEAEHDEEEDHGDDDEEEGEGDDDDARRRRRRRTTTLGRARLIDINPWAPRTDPLLFDWRELLDMRVARPLLGSVSDADAHGEAGVASSDDEDEGGGGDEEGEEEDTEPELRLVERDDPAAYNFSSPQYSAHKLPKEVVDASLGGEGGMREFARRWQRMTEGMGGAQQGQAR